MSTTLATILVGLGYDLSAIEKGAPDAFRLINQQTAGMSSEMKRASREGAESWRLIDEALGIHVSRPLTRIVTQEFPGFAKAMQSLLGAGVVGALGVAAFEGIDRLMQKIDQAKKAQEEWSASTVATQKLMADGTQHYAEAIEMVNAKIAAAAGHPEQLHALEQMRELGKNVDDTRKLVDQLAQAFEREGKAAEVAMKWYNAILVQADNAPENIVRGINALDPFGGKGSSALKFFDQGDQVKQLNAVFSSMKDNLDETFRTDALKGTHDSLRLIDNDLQMANAELQRMQQNGNKTGTALADSMVTFLTQTKAWTEQLQQLNEAQRKLQQQNDANEAAKKAAEQQKAAIADLQGDLKRWNDEANRGWQEWMKINDAIDAATAKLSESVLAEQASQAAHARKAFFPDIGQVAPPPGAPMLADQAELQKVSDDQNASWQKAGEILAQIETPIEKYTAGLQMLKILQDEGRLSADQFALAQQKLAEALQASEDRMQKLLRQGGAAGGAQAFAMQWAGDTSKGSTGQFTFDLLNKGLQGFEDEAVKAATGAKTSFRQFFESLDQMALKFLLNKELAGLFKMFSDSSFGKSMGLGNLFSAANPAQIAQTTALTANTAAITALTATMTAVGASGAAGGAGKSLFDLGIPAFADGTDYAPGGMSLVGENGPELVNLPAGSSVTPNSAFRSTGSSTVHVNIDARGAQMGVGEQIARSWEINGPAMVTRAVAEAFESQRRSLSTK